MSLVAYYSDSDEDDDNSGNKEEPCSTTEDDAAQGDEKCKRQKSISGEVSKSSLLLSGAGSCTSESDSDEEDSKPKKRPSLNGIKLDNPFRMVGGASTAVKKEDSVFRNPFREKEDQKIAVLEHHVKMTENPETALTINGKKICWNYRKRKCYLGTKCPYAHDSDVPLTEEQLQEQKVEDDLHRQAAGAGAKFTFTPTGSKTVFTPKTTHLPGTASTVAGGYDSSAFYSSPHLSGSKKPEGDPDESSESSPKKSKKRAGLTNSLIPPKKALNLYLKTKDT